MWCVVLCVVCSGGMVSVLSFHLGQLLLISQISVTKLSNYNFKFGNTFYLNSCVIFEQLNKQAHSRWTSFPYSTFIILEKFKMVGIVVVRRPASGEARAKSMFRIILFSDKSQLCKHSPAFCSIQDGSQR